MNAQLRARAEVAKAVRSGTLAPASSKTCADCGSQAEVYDHRFYERPLEVEAVCQGCNLRRGPAHDWGANPVINHDLLDDQVDVTVAFSAEQYARIQRFAGGIGMPVATFVLSATLRTVEKKGRTIDQGAFQALSRIASELCEIGREIDRSRS